MFATITPNDAAGGLRGDVPDRGRGVDAVEPAVGERDRRIEVGARHRAECQDQRHEHAGGGERVLEELQAHVVGEVLGHDARSDDRGEEERRADELAGQAPDVGCPAVVGAVPLGHPMSKLSISCSTRARISSRTVRTNSTGCPAGSVSSQSSYRLPG